MSTLTIHGELSADGASIVLMATGAQHEVAGAAGWLQLLTPLFHKSDPPGALLLPATWAGAVQLGYTFGPAWRPGPRLLAWLRDEVLRRTPAPGAELNIHLPEGLVPRPYQVDGALMISKLGRALLFDEAGTGKTITTILGLLERAEAGHLVAPVIVVAPASVVDPWVDAWRTWAPAWRVQAWRGAPDHRKRLAARPPATAAHVVVVSYDTARMDAAKGKPLDRLSARTVVIDECHLIKSATTARSVAARRLARRAAHFVALSGTPITHHPGDLWPTLEAMAPTAWPSGERWKTRYCLTVQGDYSARVLGLDPAAEPELRSALLGQHRRVAKADVLSQLPPKIYSVRTVELPAAYRTAYDGFEENMLAHLPDGQELSVMDVLAQINFLNGLASSAGDVRITTEIATSGPREGEEVAHTHLDLRLPSWKVDALLEVLAERPDEQVVAFAPSRQLIMLAGQQAAAAGIEVGYVVGGQSMRERTETVDAFQRGKTGLLCATTGAGGVGLTLTAARTVVFLQRPWSLVEASQAEDRCHRIGSEVHDSIEIIDIVASKTIDSRIREVLYGKAGQLAALLQDPRIVTQLLGGKKAA